MQKDMRSLIAIAALAGIGGGGFGGVSYSTPEPRMSSLPGGYRSGRRFRNGRPIVAIGGNPAGTKLARLAERGMLGMGKPR